MKLLSDVYQHCAAHIEECSVRVVRAAFAFILTTTSQGYFQLIRTSIGSGAHPSTFLASQDPFVITTDPDAPEEIPSFKVPKQEHPSFVPIELQRNLRNAQKSLRLLQAARADHPLLQEASQSLSSLGWFWTSKEIADAWDRRERHSDNEAIQIPRISSSEDGPSYKAELTGLQLFDRDPGEMISTSLVRLQNFIVTFPDALPSLTPSLDILTSLVLSPLAEHAAMLSGALLDVFTTKSIKSSPLDLNLHSHLTLLRSFLLLTSHLFKTKLSTALFSDSDQFLWGGQSGDARSLALNSRPPTGPESHKPWPVGLALGLIERESWPPGGGDLSFYLRTVIVDSTEVRPKRNWSDHEEEDLPPTAFEEAESRLGFAIRDLPMGKGRDRWLDPCCESCGILLAYSADSSVGIELRSSFP